MVSVGRPVLAATVHGSVADPENKAGGFTTTVRKS